MSAIVLAEFIRFHLVPIILSFLHFTFHLLLMFIHIFIALSLAGAKMDVMMDHLGVWENTAGLSWDVP